MMTDIRLNVDSLELRMYRLLVAKNLETVFPNTIIAFRIYLSLMILNCSGGRSFSKLKLIKNQLRSCMMQKRLNSLVLLSIENGLLRSITFTRPENETLITDTLHGHDDHVFQYCSCCLASVTFNLCCCKNTYIIVNAI